MKQFILKHAKTTAAITACLFTGSIILMSFQDTPYVNQILNERPKQKDTFPQRSCNSSMTMKEFDKLIEEMDTHMFQAGEDIKNLDLGLIQQQAELALQQIDVEKIMKDVTLSLKEINIDKIMAEVSESLKGINWEGHEAETKEALQEAKEEVEKARQELKSVDMPAIKMELEKAREEIKKINTEEIRKELQNARLEIERTKDELSKIDMKKIMAEATESIAEAKMELKQIKAMFNEMERDGLIHAKDGFTIEFKDKDLYINGVKQKESVTDKYRKYTDDEHFKITIEKE